DPAAPRAADAGGRRAARGPRDRGRRDPMGAALPGAEPRLSAGARRGSALSSRAVRHDLARCESLTAPGGGSAYNGASSATEENPMRASFWLPSALLLAASCGKEEPEPLPNPPIIEETGDTAAEDNTFEPVAVGFE